MGWMSKLRKAKQAFDLVRQIAPLLPLPEKAKVVIDKAGHAKDDITVIVEATKRTKPAPPPTKPAA